MNTAIDKLVKFWFQDIQPKDWFMKSDDFDETVGQIFGPYLPDAGEGELDAWMETAHGCLALCLILDQAPRNMFRNDPKAFSFDQKALQVANHALEQGFDQQLDSDNQRMFVYLPLEHSENLDDQNRCVELASHLSGDWSKYAKSHQVIIEQFGRFPHRNKILGRASTPEELEFLTRPNSSF